MGRGFLSGLILGSVLSMVILATVSLVVPLPEREAPVAEVPTGKAPRATASSTASESVQDRAAPAGLQPPSSEASPVTAAPMPSAANRDSAPTGTGRTTGREANESVASSVSVPAGSEFRRAPAEHEARLPVAGDAPFGARAPEPPSLTTLQESPGLAVTEGQGGNRPARPGMSVAAPMAPTGTETSADSMVLPETGASPATPALSEPDTPHQPTVETTPEAETATTPLRPKALTPLGDDQSDALAPVLPSAEESDAGPIAPLQGGASLAQVGSGRLRPVAPVRLLPTAGDARSPVGWLAAVASPDDAVAAPSDTTLQMIGSPATPLPARHGRLARAAATPDILVAATPARLTPYHPSLDRNAVAFESAGDKPLMAIVLLPANGPVMTGDLDGLGFSVGVAVDRSAPTAADQVARFVRAGAEVLLLASDLPDGPEAETALRESLAAMPGVMAVMDTETRRFTRSDDLAQRIQSVAAEKGHGIVGWQEDAARLVPVVEVSPYPTALVQMTVDSAATDPQQVRLLLDSAVDIAARDGSVLVALRARPRALDILGSWAGGASAASISLAPVSALLRQQ